MCVLAVAYMVSPSGMEGLQCLLFIMTCHWLCFRRYCLIKDQGIGKSRVCVGSTRYVLVHPKKEKYICFNNIIRKLFRRKKVRLERWPSKVYLLFFQQTHIHSQHSHWSAHNSVTIVVTKAVTIVLGNMTPSSLLHGCLYTYGT